MEIGSEQGTPVTQFDYLISGFTKVALCNAKECWLLFMKEVCIVDREEYGMWNQSAWMQSLDPPLNMYVTLPGVPPNFMQQESMCQKFGQDIAGHVVSPHTF